MASRAASRVRVWACSLVLSAEDLQPVIEAEEISSAEKTRNPEKNRSVVERILFVFMERRPLEIRSTRLKLYLSKRQHKESFEDLLPELEGSEAAVDTENLTGCPTRTLINEKFDCGNNILWLTKTP